MSIVEYQEGIILYEKIERFARITINRPESLNAINQTVLRGLYEAFGEAENDDDVRSVIFTGAGRAFSAGGDLNEIAERRKSGEEDAAPDPNDVEAAEVYLRIWDLSKPVIAAIPGHAVGQGCEIAAICDFTIASEKAKIGEIQIRHGFGTPVLITPYLMTPKQAKEVLLTGDILDVHEAQRLGLVNKVVPHEKLQEEAEALARKIADLPRDAVKQGKARINRSYEIRGILASINHTSDPSFADLAEEGIRDEDEGAARLNVIQERGWEAFIRERDRMYRDKTE